MKYIVDILKQFTQSQRLMVLIIILITILAIQYFKTDDCRGIIDENIKMHKDFVTLSEMLRKDRMSNFKNSTQDTISIDSTIIFDNIESEMLKIIESNINK